MLERIKIEKPMDYDFKFFKLHPFNNSTKIVYNKFSVSKRVNYIDEVLDTYLDLLIKYYKLGYNLNPLLDGLVYTDGASTNTYLCMYITYKIYHHIFNKECDDENIVDYSIDFYFDKILNVVDIRKIKDITIYTDNDNKYEQHFEYDYEDIYHQFVKISIFDVYKSGR